MSESAPFLSIKSGDAVAISRIPVFPIARFRELILDLISKKFRLLALFSNAPHSHSKAPLFAALSDDEQGNIHLAASEPVQNFPSLTPACPQAHLFEREIYENSGLVPENHPWLKPVRKTPANRTSFFQEQGAQVHEIGVGPIHAGIIEPGHFRFQCHGENVRHLEIQLGYQHRGIEKMIPCYPSRSLSLAEAICGDSAVSHAWAHCAVMEALSNRKVGLEAEAVRASALELERIANHLGDLAAISGDIGYLPASAYFGRMRGDFLNLLMRVSGHRYGKGLIKPGGTTYDIPDSMRSSILKTLKDALRETQEVGDMFFGASSVLSRLENVGVLPPKFCEELGIVGVAAKAAGLKRDARESHPFEIYRSRKISIARLESSDVYARTFLRFIEIKNSLTFLTDLLKDWPAAGALSPKGKNRPRHLALSLIEGWRGEICHIGQTGPDGEISYYKIIDPSFHNWIGLALVMRNQEISDFPLCNKSFNLSYAGHDL